MREMDARAWLFKHGFNVSTNDHHFVGRFYNMKVHIRMADGSGTTWISDGKKKTPLRDFEVRELRLDEHGMLHAAGIDNYFIDRMNFGAPAPVWFPKPYEKHVRLAISQRHTYDRNWACGYAIIEWGLRNAFERVAHRILRGVFDGAMTELELGIDRMSIRVMDSEGRFAVRQANYHESGYDIYRMLTGLPRSHEHLEDEPPPFWR